jgi:hypothetical protein
MSAKCPFLTSNQTHWNIFSPDSLAGLQTVFGWNFKNLDLGMPDYFWENDFYEFGINFEKGKLCRILFLN